MVHIRRPGIHHHCLCNGPGHDSRSRFPLLWSCTKKVGAEHDLGLYGLFLHHHIPMVLLGLLSGILTIRDERIHWRLAKVRTHEDSGCAFAWFPFDSRSSLCFLPGMYSARKLCIQHLLYLVLTRLQMQFCATTGAIVVGAVAERGRLIPMMVFIFCWATLVYCPIACWVWNVNGWAYKWGVYDYAGGGPVEIGSGLSALAYSWILGRRQEKMMLNFRPHNVSLITLGTVFLWFGWLGFNGGSAFGANLRATMACWNSNLTAMFGAITWVLLDWRLARKWSMVGWCSGCISGLVAATPASGFIPPWASVILGIVTGLVCNFSTKSESLSSPKQNASQLTLSSQVLDPH